MKHIKICMSPERVHLLVEELQQIGIFEIKVTEYFRLLSHATRFEFICKEGSVASAVAAVHRIGTLPYAEDTVIDAQDVAIEPPDDANAGQLTDISPKESEP